MPRRGVKWVLACDVSIFYPLNSNVKHIHARTSDRNISNLAPTNIPLRDVIANGFPAEQLMKPPNGKLNFAPNS